MNLMGIKSPLLALDSIENVHFADKQTRSHASQLPVLLGHHTGIMLRIETNTQFTDHYLSLGDFNNLAYLASLTRAWFNN